MMRPVVTMLDTTGLPDHSVVPYQLDEEARTWLIGRGEGCVPQLPTDQRHRDVSRYHCLVRVDEHGVWIRDLGSLNGTYVNGKRLGKSPRRERQRERGSVAEQRSDMQRLLDGDEVILGVHTIFRVRIREDHEQPLAPTVH